MNAADRGRETQQRKIRMRLVFSCLSLFSFLSVVCSQSVDDLTFTNISVKDGLTQGTVHSIYQDGQGFMWFGTGDGLNRYDGYEFKTFKQIKGDSTSISNNIINCIVEDGEGYLWVGTTNGLNRYDPHTELFTRYKYIPGDETSLSNNYVKSMFMDENGLLWVGTDMYLNRLDTRTGIFSHHTFDGKLANSRIFDIHKDAYNDIWLATRNSGLIRFKPETFEYVQYLYDPTDDYSISSDHVYVIFEDSGDELWFGTWEHGVNGFDRGRDRFNRIPVNKDGTGLNNNQIRCISENEDRNLWIGTFEGLNIYDPINKTFEYCLRHNNVPGSLSYNTINYIFRDRTGSTWLGTNGGGIDLYNPLFKQFHLIDPKLIANHDYGFIGPLVEYEGKLWIGTEGGGLARYDLQTKEYRYFDLYNPDRGALNSNTIKALCLDRNHSLWVGTYAGGIQTFDIGRNSFNHSYDSFDGLDNNIVNDIFEDSKGNIWVGSNTVEGVHLKEYGSNRFTAGFEMRVDSQRVDFPWIRTILEPNTDEIWFGSIYYGIFIYKDGKTTRHLSTINSGLTSDYISALMEDSNEQMWIGTYGGGINLYDHVKGMIRSFTTADGLLNDNICSVIEDEYGTIWIGTVAGISRFNTQDSTFTNFSFNKSSFPIETLNLKSGLLASDGQVYFGGSNGIVHFHPQNIVSNRYIPPVVLTGLSLNNKTLRPGDDTGVLQHSITETEGITLRYDQTNNLTIEFAALNYLFPENNQYMVFLEGYEEDWNKPGFQRQVTYTNLPAGKYILKIKGSNDSGIWNQKALSFTIHVLPPPWKTWWAYALYVFFFAGLLYAVFYYFVSRMKLENDIRVKQLEKQTLEQVHQTRLNMFTNFSHELRTPLTLILNPLKSILSDTSFPTNYKDPLQMVYKNANRMLLLVNQLLDLRKQEAGKLQIKVREGDMVKFIREITIIFRELAHSKNIDLTLTTKDDRVVTWFDPFLLEKVFYNLLSNAIKNTPDGGLIHVEVHRIEEASVKIRKEIISLLPDSSSYVEITVCDSGRGIPAEDLERIFAPFFQVDEIDMPGTYGTGLGLHITKSVIQQHHGLIRAENQAEGGACFRILLPVNKKVFKEEDFSPLSADYSVETAFSEKYESVESQTQSTSHTKNTPIVLVVDDNTDIRQFMKSQLQDYYTVHEAANGEIGWELAEKIIPDIVISDIMMPVIDGLELCAKIKSHVKTSHVPVILLTARTSLLQIEEGLMTGADDYITKPFDAELLKIRIRNMIENRRKVKQAYLKNFTVGTPIPRTGNLDDIFLNRAHDYVRENMSDPNLSIEEFGNQLYLSRTQLYRKIKALTGMSPSLFVSTLRLKFAAELLAESTLSVSEIAYQAGFSNPSYFTTSFKKLYNITPSDYLQQKRQG